MNDILNDVNESNIDQKISAVEAVLVTLREQKDLFWMTRDPSGYKKALEDRFKAEASSVPKRTRAAKGTTQKIEEIVLGVFASNSAVEFTADTMLALCQVNGWTTTDQNPKQRISQVLSALAKSDSITRRTHGHYVAKVPVVSAPTATITVPEKATVVDAVFEDPDLSEIDVEAEIAEEANAAE